MKPTFLLIASMLISLAVAAPAIQDSVKQLPAVNPPVKTGPATTSLSTAKAQADTVKSAKTAAIVKKDSSTVKKVLAKTKAVVKKDSTSAKKDTVKTASADSVKADTAAPAAFGRCSVSTEPAEALVYIGDSLKGKSPLVIDSLPPDTIEMQIKKKGYFIKKASIIIEAGKTQTITFELTKPKRLVVATEPAGALLKINETDTARTPYVNDKMKADTIALSITKDGYEGVIDTVVLDTTGNDSLFYLLKSLAPAKDTAKVAESPAHSDRNTRIRALISLGVFLVFTGAVLGVELSR